MHAGVDGLGGTVSVSTVVEFTVSDSGSQSTGASIGSKGLGANGT